MQLQPRLCLFGLLSLTSFVYAAPTVENGYVRTPAGVFPASCVQDVGDNARVIADGRVTYSDGREATLPSCPVQKHLSDAPDYTPPGSWIMDSIAQSSVPAIHMTSTFVVPPAPSASEDQLDYFFPGMRPANGASVLQPVLQWGGGDPSWQIASWSCAAVSGGPCPHSSYVSVNSGDTIFGEIQGSNCNSDGACDWTIITTDKTTGQSTTLNTQYDWRSYTLLFGGVLESYDVGQCADYPAGGKITFTGVNFYDAKANLIVPQWYPQYDDTSYCHQSIQTTSDTTELDFIDTSAR